MQPQLWVVGFRAPGGGSGAQDTVGVISPISGRVQPDNDARPTGGLIRSHIKDFERRELLLIQSNCRLRGQFHRVYYKSFAIPKLSDRLIRDPIFKCNTQEDGYYALWAARPELIVMRAAGSERGAA